MLSCPKCLGVGCRREALHDPCSLLLSFREKRLHQVDSSCGLTHQGSGTCKECEECIGGPCEKQDPTLQEALKAELKQLKKTDASDAHNRACVHGSAISNENVMSTQRSSAKKRFGPLANTCTNTPQRIGLNQAESDVKGRQQNQPVPGSN